MYAGDDIDNKFEQNENDDNGTSLSSYDISSAPNDFNTVTLCNLFDMGVVKIPGFQRNYIWDIKRASKLIESLLIGIPIPQLFLYEKAKNEYLLIDGQQRYSSIYFFIKGKFPKADARIELRDMINNGGIPEDVLQDKRLFADFQLYLPQESDDEPVNKFNGLTYLTLSEEDKFNFDLKTIRSVIIKQNAPDDGDSAMFEVFNRLNTGGVNLRAQEIRASLYASDFYNKLVDLNLNVKWRKLLQTEVPNLHMADIEIMLRGFAFLCNFENYKSNLKKFLNTFSKQAMKFDKQYIDKLGAIFCDFVDYVVQIKPDMFWYKDKFVPALYEAVFYTLCADCLNGGKLRTTTADKVLALSNNEDFRQTLVSGSSATKNVKTRFAIANETL